MLKREPVRKNYMGRYFFVTRIPDEPGSLEKAALVMKENGANINRVHYDHRIDPNTVFFEVTAGEESYNQVMNKLQEIGYLQTSLRPHSTIRFYIKIPNEPGALSEFLSVVTSSRANITELDFDDRSQRDDRLIVGLSLEDSSKIERLLERLRPRYTLEVIEYDETENNLDNTVFYLRLAHRIKTYAKNPDDRDLLAILADTNHIVQELAKTGKDPKEAFEKILCMGESLKGTLGPNFYADVQKVRLKEGSMLYVFQLPCGGNLNVIDTQKGRILIDTGYGIYADDVREMLGHYGLSDFSLVKDIVITHADADHCGASGYFGKTARCHSATIDVLKRENRAYGSRNEDSVLEELYTKLIDLFSHASISDGLVPFSSKVISIKGKLPVIDNLSIGPFNFEVIEGLGGHQYGQIYLLEPKEGLIFTADTLLNLEHISKERSLYNNLAVYLVTSVNVDSSLVKEERTELLAIAKNLDDILYRTGRRCIICGGHGPVSVLHRSGLSPYGSVEHYTHNISS